MPSAPAPAAALPGSTARRRSPDMEALHPRTSSQSCHPVGGGTCRRSARHSGAVTDLPVGDAITPATTCPPPPRRRSAAFALGEGYRENPTSMWFSATAWMRNVTCRGGRGRGGDVLRRGHGRRGGECAHSTERSGRTPEPLLILGTTGGAGIDKRRRGSGEASSPTSSARRAHHSKHSAHQTQTSSTAHASADTGRATFGTTSRHRRVRLMVVDGRRQHLVADGQQRQRH